MNNSKRLKQEIKGGSKMQNVEIEGYHMQEKNPVYIPVYINGGSNRDLSSYIRNSLTRLDMLIYLDRKEEAQAEIQTISEELEKMGI